MPRRRRPPRPGALTELPPLKILGQIAALQGLYYLAALVLMCFTALVAGTGFSADLVFGWAPVRGDTTQGWLMAFIWVLDGGMLMALAIILLIGRSKLVLDFALSLHVIHLVVVTLYTGGRLPSHTAWWLAMAASSAVAGALGTWGCRYRELKPIAFGGHSSSGATGGGGVDGGARRQSGAGGAGAADGDVEQGYSRGRGRGRGRDGAGEYEMVKMNGDSTHNHHTGGAETDR
ncbi:integral membrane protein S linking to the trans Golgi network-domain-containing protein [Apodospora peruviana]|uniref:Integral membrane protein S linking to the trans Golgi network-domain-containing protein n=1 Tax=Apodospora peruviana TaxID=516989 RepID=A0AAE0IAS7_9PEZI|nr:integral membrane protein S linking to the trans Golgi network-domain-containing protein [Apodospora peruviana]